MTVYAPDVAYRGTRSYVHSTDLYAEILAGCDHVGLGVPDGPMEVRFRRKLTVQPEICFITANDDRHGGAAAEFFVTIAGQRVSGVVRATTRPVRRRKAYDERPIWNCAALCGPAISLRATCDAAPIEVVTALGVLQHRSLYPPSAGGRWMLGRLELVRPLSSFDGGAVEITVRQQIAGRMTRSSIASGETTLGAMDFLLGEA